MAWYPDLGTQSMIASGPHVRAVGWLSCEHPFPTGDTSAVFRARLRDFCALWGECVDALNWDLCMGGHTCDLCSSNYASGYIGVPAGPLLYVAPDMVAHYVAAHRYLPPSDFVAAVMGAPLPGSKQYMIAVKQFRQSLDDLAAR